MPDVIAGQNITITDSALDGGIIDIYPYGITVNRRKNGGSWIEIGSYNMSEEGDYTPPDPNVEGSVGEYDFSYSTTIPEDAEKDDAYEYQFVDSIFGITRVTGEYTTIESSGVEAFSESLSTSLLLTI